MMSYSETFDPRIRKNKLLNKYQSKPLWQTSQQGWARERRNEAAASRLASVTDLGSLAKAHDYIDSIGGGLGIQGGRQAAGARDAIYMRNSPVSMYNKALREREAEEVNLARAKNQQQMEELNLEKAAMEMRESRRVPTSMGGNIKPIGGIKTRWTR